MIPPSVVSVFTPHSPRDTDEPLRRVVRELTGAGMEVRLPPEEAQKHELEPCAGLVLDAEPDGDTDLALVLGGDGTILRALRAFAGRDVPTFAFNFGAIGFLATVDREEFEDGMRRVLEGDYDILRMPALSIAPGGERQLAVNDVSFHRRASNRVAELAYSVEGDQLGRVRCDGLVASTPVGSTGYNLANGGPVLAWGVDGFVVSFIAPHTLTARALVVATDAWLRVQNCSDTDPVDVTTDGRIVCELGPGDEMEVRFEHDRVLLAQRPGSNFYHRLREKFGRLAY